MSDAPRRSPWLPVTGDAPAPGSVPTGEVPLPTRPPATPAPEPVVSPAPEPATGEDASARRSPALSPYFAPRDGMRPVPSAAPAGAPPSATAYAAAPPEPDPAQAWAPMRPAGIDPVVAASASASPVTLTKPAQPIVAAPARVPRPIEAEDPEVIRPVAAPPAHEILPTTGGIPLPPMAFAPEPGAIPTFEPADEIIDPVRLLGESAVTAASLDAAGAPTPARGIPLATPDALPNFGDEAEFVPRFEPDDAEPVREAPMSAGLAAPEPPKTPVRAPLTGEQPRVSFTAASGMAAAPGEGAASGIDALAPLPRPPASSFAWAEVAGELPARGPEAGTAPGANPPAPTSEGGGYGPIASVPASPSAVTIASAPPAVPPAPLPPADEKPRRRLLWLWIVLGLVIAAGLGVLVYRLFFLPEPIILPAPVVTEAPPTPTIEPVAVTDASAFLAGMPTEIATFVLTSYEVVEVIGDESLPARAAEHVVLTYGESTGDAHFTVNAYQFYNTDDAATAFGVWSEGASSTDEVTVDGVAVGERALVSSGGETSVVWSNGTSVFVLEGPADEVEQFYAYFGL